MSSERIQFKPEELISFFAVSDPPENYSEFLPVFIAECQQPLDQSLFNNWKPKQSYRPNNRNLTLGGSSSTMLGASQQVSGESQQAPIQSTSSTPVSAFSPLSQQPSNQQIKNFQPTNFQPSIFQPTNQVPNNIQPVNPSFTSFQPTTYLSPDKQAVNFQPANFQATSFQPTNQQSTNFLPTNMQATNFQPANQQFVNFQPANMQATSFQPVNQQFVNFQPTNMQPTSFQPTNQQFVNFQPTNLQPTSFQPTNQQSVNFQPTNLQAADFQPSVFQPVIQPIIQPNIQYNQNEQYNPQQNQETQEINENNFSQKYEEKQEQQNQDYAYVKPNTNLESFESVIGEQNVEKAEAEAKQRQLQEQMQRQQQQQMQQEQEDQKRLHEAWINNNKDNQNQPDMNEIIAEQQHEAEIEEEKNQQRNQEQQKQQESWTNNTIEKQKQPDMNEIIENQQHEAEIKEEQNRQRNQEQRKQQEYWDNNTIKKQKQPSMNNIIEDQKVISSIEAKQKQEQQKMQQQKQEKSAVNSWNNTNVRQTSSKSAFEDIIASQKQTQTQPKQKAKSGKFKGGNVTKMSFQDLQREVSKPSQWGPQVIENPAPSFSNIIASVSESAKPAQTSNAPTTSGKGKKKKTKEVYDFQEFYRMNEEQERAKKEAIWTNAAKGSNKKSFQKISTEALIESEKNRQSFNAPTPAPVYKRPNHRARGKELNPPQRYNYDDEEDDDDYYYNEPKQAPKTAKPSFDSITNSEIAKQKPTQTQTKNTTTTNSNTNTGSKSKKKKQIYQPYQPSTTQTSTWGAVSGSEKSTTTTAPKKPIDFNQIQESVKNDQTNKPSNTKNTAAASNVSAVQPKKKKKGKKILYPDNFFLNQQKSPMPYSYDDGSSDDDDYYIEQRRPTKKSTNFIDLLNNETKNKQQVVKQQQQPYTNIRYTKPPTSIKKTSFETLTQQEIDHQQANQVQPVPIVRSDNKSFKDKLQDEQKIGNAQDVQIIDDIDYPISSKKNGQQTRTKQGKNAKKNIQDDNNELFWGKTVNDEDQFYEEDYDDNYDQFHFGNKSKAPKNERAVYLQQLIENKLGSRDNDLYDFAVEVINNNKNREKMIRALRSLLEDEKDARSVVTDFFKKYPK